MPTSVPRIVLAGVGGDAHSVGLTLLYRALHRKGYDVDFLGIQAPLAEIVLAARHADAVLISNLDGHARYYLTDLPALRAELGTDAARWYLGGQPVLSADEDAVEELHRLGFDRILTAHAPLASVLALLAADLPPVVERDTVLPPRRPPALDGRPRRRESIADQREEVLAQWHTGEAVRDRDKNAESLIDRISMHLAQRHAAACSTIMLQPRTGVAGPRGQLDLFHALADAGADALSFQIDSLTRNNAYADVELILKRQTESDATLNGFPAVNHGVEVVRAIAADFPHIPLQVRHSTRDPRLLAEISFGAGITSFEGGAITYNLPYYRNYTPREAVARWRYVDALTASYHARHGIVLDREFFGVLTAALIPPCLAIAADVLEALLAAEAGVKSLSLGYAEQGNRVQDVAAIRALHSCTRAYLDRFGHGDVHLSTVFHQFMGAFPADAAKAQQLIRASAVTAHLSGATRALIKTYVEATAIPNGQQNVDSLKLVRTAIEAASDELDPAAVAEEHALIAEETRAIVDAALHAGSGDFGEAVVQAISRGFLDVPFSPSLWNAGRTLCVRDETGAVRFADPGGLPLPRWIARKHADLVRRRRRREDRTLEEIIEADILDIASGAFDRWPLSQR